VARRLHTFVTFASLLLILFLLLLWARSGDTGDLLSWDTRSARYRLRSDWGRLAFIRISGDDFVPQRLTWQSNNGGYHGAWPGPAPTHFDAFVSQFRAGPCFSVTFAFGSGSVTFPATTRYWAVELYHPTAIALAALPLLPAAVRFRARLRRRGRIRAGLCPACGYNLRTTPDQCPECGEAAPAAAVSASPAP
jgi:hypothetical protein